MIVFPGLEKVVFFFSSRRRHTRLQGDWSSDVCSNDWSYFSTHERFGYLRKALGEIERTWITQFKRGVQAGEFRADLDARLTYHLLRDVLWIPTQWGAAGGGVTTRPQTDAPPGPGV